MAGYLLDTNIVRFWFDTARPEHAMVARRIAGLPEGALLALSAITLGEIEYGHRLLGAAVNREQEESFLAFIEYRLPMKLDVGRHTRIAYGLLRARLFESFAPKGRRRKGLRPEELVDPTTSRELGIQENDIWIAAQALEHNLVLVTHDQMARLREVATGLGFEDWARPEGG